MDYSHESNEHTQLLGSGASSSSRDDVDLYLGRHYKFFANNPEVVNLEIYTEYVAHLLNSDYFLPSIEPYEQTLEDILKYCKGEKFWRDSPNGTRMGRYLQNIFCDIISGLEILNESKYNFDLNVSKVVFLESRAELEKEKGDKPQPRLVYIWNAEGNTPESYESARLWQQLGELVENVVSLAEVQPHPEITAFCTLLKTHCRGSVARVVCRHPALLSEEKKLDVAVEIREYMYMKTGPTRYYNKQAYQNEFDSWIDIVKGDPCFGKLFKRMEDACEKKGCANLRFNNNTSGLLIFVRNSVVNFHMLEMNTRYELWERFDNLFPKLLSFAFEKHVMNYKKRKIEDQNFVIEVAKW